MGLAEDSAAIDGKLFASNYIYSVATNLFNESTANGHPTYFGSVGQFTATSISGTVAVTDAANGVFTLGGATYHIQGTDPTGAYLIFGTGASGGNPAFALANSGTTSPIDVRFSSGNGYTPAAVACFVAGTRILTERGEVAVEALRLGDRVPTADGRMLPVTWLGRRRVQLGRSPWRDELRPVEIAADAFGDGLPARPLRLSPGHAVAVRLLDTVLIPAAALVNGCTIRRLESEAVTYWHVELAEHAVLHADGLSCESYLDVGNRAQFAGEGAVVALPMALDPVGTGGVHRVVHDGAIVTAVREQLVARAERLGWRSAEAAADVRLEVDGAIVMPEFSGDRARFAMPLAPRSIRLLSATHVPAEHDPRSADGRRLGLKLRALAISDGFGAPRPIALDGALLGRGWHAPEPGFRWTDGRATIDAAAWADVGHGSYLTIEAERFAAPRWFAAAAGEARVAA